MVTLMAMLLPVTNEVYTNLKSAQIAESRLVLNRSYFFTEGMPVNVSQAMARQQSNLMERVMGE
jgi:hypothetical protein